MCSQPFCDASRRWPRGSRSSPAITLGPFAITSPTPLRVGLVDLDVDAGQRAADRCPAIDLVAGPRHGQHRRRLGHAVALVQVEARGRGTPSCVSGGSAEPPLISRRIRPPSLRWTGKNSSLPVPKSHGSLSRSDRLTSTIESNAFSTSTPASADVLVDLALEQLPQRRHPDHAGDALVLERARQRVGLELLEVVDRGAVHQRHQEAGRELEACGAAAAPTSSLSCLYSVNSEASLLTIEVRFLCGEHHALGRAGGARGEDQRRERVALDARAGPRRPRRPARRAARRTRGPWRRRPAARASRRTRRAPATTPPSHRPRRRRSAPRVGLAGEPLDDLARQHQRARARHAHQVDDLGERQLACRAGPRWRRRARSRSTTMPHSGRFSRHQHDAVARADAELAQHARALPRQLARSAP